jgi:hypothetical protein
MLASSSSLAAFSKQLGREMPIVPLRPNILLGSAPGGVLKPWVEDWWKEVKIGSGAFSSLSFFLPSRLPNASSPLVPLAPVASSSDAVCRTATIRLTSNCVRCISLNIDYDTGKRLEGTGLPLQVLAKDRRVDTGSYSPVFVRRCCLPFFAVMLTFLGVNRVDTVSRTTLGRYFLLATKRRSLRCIRRGRYLLGPVCS